MFQIDAQPFSAAARTIRARLLLDLSDPSAHLLDATVRSQRSGTRRFAFRDGLIGFGVGLRDVLLAWGVPDHAIFTNDSAVAGFFIRRKYWDFAVRDSAGREQALIELSSVRPNESLSKLCLHLLGVLTDLRFMPRPAFTGLVFVCCNLEHGLTPNVSRTNREQLERFDRACRQSGFLDAMTYIEVTPDAVTEPAPLLSLERFLWMLHRKLDGLPRNTWEACLGTA